MLQPAAPLRPRVGKGVLRVAIIGRISTEHQNIENIEASYRYVETYLQQIYQGPVEIKLLGEQASGMLTTRASIREAESLVAEGAVDLVIAEDLSRIYRNPRHQYDFVQNAVDAGTRVICIGDHLDTADDNWEVMMGAATLRHGLFIPDTRRRVRRTATNSFRQGGMVGKIRFGYRKLTKEEAASGAFGPKGLRIAKLPECTPVIRDMRERVLSGESYASIADWLNVEGMRSGSYTATGLWTGRLVVLLLRDPILSGTRRFRRTVYEPVFRTGEHRRRCNDAPETQHHDELAHLTREEQETLWREMDRRAAELGLKPEHRQQRRNVPRSRSIYPGQSARCGICGSLMYYAGKHLRCRNSLPHAPTECWNHAQVSADLVRHRLIAWLCEYAQAHPAFFNSLARVANNLREHLRCRPRQETRYLQQGIADLERQARNLAQAIAMGGELEALLHESQVVQDRLQAARKKLAESADTVPGVQQVMEANTDTKSLDQILDSLAKESFEFADLLRKLFPRFTVCPVQALDTPQVRPVGKFRFDPSALLPDPTTVAGSEIELELELFVPPQHIRHVGDCVAATQAGPKQSLRTVAATLGLNYMTVKRALAYARLMEKQGLLKPYRELTQRPSEGSRWRKRHLLGTSTQ